ncbi:MAG TPA: glycosyltransferase [Candidatus Methylomirabilis sp.]|nr:glycosyltransferase [Candidatus Methylomirabilis sp.]
MPRLSIIIPTKNEEVHLPRLLASIKEQTFTDYEVIVADAHSNDGTRRIAEEWGARVVEGGMPGEGRNEGALHAQGELLLFLDADVVLPSHHYLRDVIVELDERKADVATCKVAPLSKRPIDRVFHGAYNAYVQATERIRPHAPGFCILVRRHTHEGIEGFDEDVVFAEDMDYVQRAHRMGRRFNILKSHPIKVSVRRFDRDGRWGIAMKYLFAELRMVTRGPFKKKTPFRYEMGGGKK